MPRRGAAAVSKALDRAGFAVIAIGLKQCITDPGPAPWKSGPWSWSCPSRDGLHRLGRALLRSGPRVVARSERVRRGDRRADDPGLGRGCRGGRGAQRHLARRTGMARHERRLLTAAVERARTMAASRLGAGAGRFRAVVADALQPTPAPVDGGGSDLVLFAYLQIPDGPWRTALGHGVDAALPGGTVLVICHAERNLAEGTGGPQDPPSSTTPTPSSLPAKVCLCRWSPPSCVSAPSRARTVPLSTRSSSSGDSSPDPPVCSGSTARHVSGVEPWP